MGKNKKNTDDISKRKVNKKEDEKSYWERLRNTPQSQLTDKEYDNLYRYKPQSVKEKKGALVEPVEPLDIQKSLKEFKKKGGIIRDTFTEQYD